MQREPATKADLVQIMGEAPSRTVRAWVWKDQGEVLGVAGWYMEGITSIVFSDVKDGVSKVRIWKEAVKFMQTVSAPSMCIATCGSERFLERLGWVHVYSDPRGEVYKCS